MRALPQAPTPITGNYGGLIPVANVAALDAAASARADAEKKNNAPVIQGLAGHVRKCFDAAVEARQDATERMLANLRARKGEYDPDDLAKIRATGGSELFMMLTSNKCQAATAWMQDTLLGTGIEKPWTLDPTQEPELPPDAEAEAIQRAGEFIDQMQAMLGDMADVSETMVKDMFNLAKSREMIEVNQAAKRRVTRMEAKMEDQLQEGGFIGALTEVIDDVSTFPSAFLKGPVVRNKPQLTWKPLADGAFEAVVENKLLLEWERVSPFNMYPSPGAVRINDGYLLELHTLYPHDLEALIGVEGYNEEAIRAVIAAHGQGGLNNWLAINKSERAEAEGQGSSVTDTTSPTIDALQHWGPVLGQDLLDWGMEKDKVPDPTKTYHCEVWLIGQWVIKATLNYDPFGRRPYYKASYRPIPGSFWGNAVPDLMADCQRQCNNAARALANNMAVSSGPQVGVNVDRVPTGEDVTSVTPWKVWLSTTDPYGNNTKPIEFYQPTSNAAELMGIYEKFATLADEYTGIPRYMTGDQNVGGAGRTASGMSMLMGNAGKSIKAVMRGMDAVISEAIERLYYHNMKYGTDPELKGDVRVVARGVSGLVVKEQAQVRRNEFLNIVMSSPIIASVIGEEAIADLLRTMAQGLDMDTDKIIPPPEVIRARIFQKRQEELQQQQMAQRNAMVGMDVPLEELQFQRDDNGNTTGVKVMPGQRQRLADGSAPTDNFAPQRTGG